MVQPESLTIRPLTPARWPDFEKLFGPRGACAGCWCMFWKLPNKDFKELAYEGNQAAQKAIVQSGCVPGLLAYSGREPVGWVAVEPRNEYPRLARSRVLAPVDGQAVWSIICFFTRRDYRGKGVTVELLKACIVHVRRHGGKIVEGYPTEPRTGQLPPPFVYMGLASAFRAAGYTEVARRSNTRPILRYVIGGNE